MTSFASLAQLDCCLRYDLPDRWMVGIVCVCGGGGLAPCANSQFSVEYLSVKTNYLVFF